MVAESSAAAEHAVDAVLRDGYEVHQAALRRGLDVLLLPRQVMMVKTPGGDELSFVHGVPSSSTLSAVTFAQDKRMRRARLVEAGLAVPKGGTFSIAKGVNDAKRLISRMGYPVVIKPAMGDNMIEVHAGLRDEAAVDRAIEYLRTHVDERPTYVKAAYALTLLGEPEDIDGRLTVPRSYRFLVEKQISGQYLRFLVLHNRVVSVVHLPSGPRALESAVDVTSDVHPSLAAMALNAVRAIAGLTVAAIDIVTSEYGQDVTHQNASIVELSERPWLGVQAAISEQFGHSLGDAILIGHAAELSIDLPEPRDEISTDVHLEGMSDAQGAVVSLDQAAREHNVASELAVADSVEGVVEGTLAGDPGAVSLITEALLDGLLDGHKANLVEERRAGGRYAGNAPTTAHVSKARGIGTEI